MTESETIERYQQVRDIMLDWFPDIIVGSSTIILNDRGEITNFDVWDWHIVDQKPIGKNYSKMFKIATSEHPVPFLEQAYTETLFPGEIVVKEKKAASGYIIFHRDKSLLAMLET